MAGPRKKESRKLIIKNLRLKKKAKKWWPVPESNWGHGDFQSPALPTELTCHIVIADYVYNIYPIQEFVKRFFDFF